MRKVEVLLRDYVSKLSLDNLRFLTERLNDRYSGDLAEALDFLAKNSELDRWLSSAKSGVELFEMIELIQEYVTKEFSRKSPEIVVM